MPSPAPDTPPPDTAVPDTLGAVLERDHQRIDEQFARFAASLDAGSLDIDALAAGSAGLRHHIYVEEEHHFPPLQQAGLVGPIMVMLREHGQLWDLLDALESRVDERADPDAIAATWQDLAHRLEDHNRKEEQILYPAGDRVLDADLTADVLDELRNRDTPEGWTCRMAGRA